MATIATPATAPDEVTYWRPDEERLPRAALEQLQLARLRERLEHVRERSPFYRRKLDGAGIRPDDIASIDDVRRIPFTVKDELKQSQADHPPWGDFACIGPQEAVRVFQTSGTTGKPVRVMLNRADWHGTFYEQFMHFRCGYGLTPADVLYVPFSYGLYVAWWGFQTAMERAGLMILPGGGQTTKERLRNMLDWGATAVCGTPSYLTYLAETARDLGLDLAGSPILKVVAAGEPGASVPATKRALERLWGAEVFDDIGSTEISNFGHECLHHAGTHVIENMFLAEVLDPETLEPVADGELGELVLSNLCCESAPLIRYRTRDLVRVDRSTCPCGRTTLRLDGGIVGRSDDMFQFAGVNVFPSQVQDLLHGIDEFAQEFQLVIPRLGSGRHLKIRVEPDAPGIPPAQLDDAAERLVEAVRARLTFTPDVAVVGLGSLPRFEGKGKRVVHES